MHSTPHHHDKNIFADAVDKWSRCAMKIDIRGPRTHQITLSQFFHKFYLFICHEKVIAYMDGAITESLQTLY